MPYQFELLVGAPTPPPGGSPYIYYSRASDLVRTAVVTGTVEPILLPDGFAGGRVHGQPTPCAASSTSSTTSNASSRSTRTAAAPQVVVANTGPNDVLRFTESLAVDERSGRIYWVQADASASSATS